MFFRIFKTVILLAVVLGLAGCTAANVSVKSLMSSTENNSIVGTSSASVTSGGTSGTTTPSGYRISLRTSVR